MKIATAQIKVTVGDINGNLKKHLELIDLAIEQKVDLIVFPEMSLTGYCREEGKQLIINQSSNELLVFQQEAQEHNLIIVIGAPIQIKGHLYIGTYILMPNGEIEIYTKQFLHAGEEDYYASSFAYNPTLKLKGETISFAICADIDNEQHPLNAKKKNCSLYIASIFFSKKGITKGHKMLADYANTHSMKILMSNYAGQVWGMEAGGKSAFWDKNGALITELEVTSEGLLVLEKKEGKWSYEKFIK